MENGIVQLIPAFNGSTETTAEEMASYMKAAAGRFCELTGLAIIEEATIQHDHGAAYVLGEPGEGQGIVAIGNVSNASAYYKVVFIARVLSGNCISNSVFNLTGNTTTLNASSFNLQRTAAVFSVYMKYIKDDTSVVFGLGDGADGAITYNPWACITKFRYGDVEKKLFLLYATNCFYASYNAFLDNEYESTILFNFSNNSYVLLVPQDKEAIADIYTIQNADVTFPYLKLFTNRKNMAQQKVLTVNGDKYVVLLKANGWSVLVKMKD